MRTPPFTFKGERVVAMDDFEECADQCLLHDPSCDGYCDHDQHINQCLVWGDEA